ncbi:RHS repeat-associated core domain-containing protein [Pseudomonas kurunegalensis]|uniref:RHS repeat-associated core domain-containing protein n=1 Tax=Pseudomonas kurunegalensis TaxID=485880 RepID=UPI001CDBF021|nr:RHS repeat-associated core domain-containing protein [Pseudomonas kurunegalensis]
MTVREGPTTRTVFRAGLQPLAETNTDIETNPLQLLTDEKGSTFTTKSNVDLQFHAYSPYGHTLTPSRSITNFNGENLEIKTQCYLLGNGCRAFSPRLMRFNSPDSWSPFGAGGINAYMYCGGDPVNHTDSSGHLKLWFKRTRTSNGHIFPALADAMQTYKSISKALISPNLGAPPTYDRAIAMDQAVAMTKAHNANSKIARESSKARRPSATCLYD